MKDIPIQKQDKIQTYPEPRKEKELEDPPRAARTMPEDRAGQEPRGKAGR